jgi:hypothetical protein
VIRLFFAALVVAFANPAAASGWTFCIGASLDAREAWLSDVFATTATRERLEGELVALLHEQGVRRVNAQCPAPSADKIDALNAQTSAEAFNKKLGVTLHALPAQDFPLRR